MVWLFRSPIPERWREVLYLLLRGVFYLFNCFLPTFTAPYGRGGGVNCGHRVLPPLPLPPVVAQRQVETISASNRHPSLLTAIGERFGQTILNICLLTFQLIRVKIFSDHIFISLAIYFKKLWIRKMDFAKKLIHMAYHLFELFTDQSRTSLYNYLLRKFICF
jgi:hypothetical protein